MSTPSTPSTPPAPTAAEAATAAELLDLRRTGRVIPDLSDELRPVDLASAYRIQDLVVAGVVGDEARPVGYKCACTSEHAQELLAVDQPLFGQLLSHTVSPSGAVLAADRFTHRVVEPEVGFRIGREVPERAGGHDAESIVEYIDAVMPSIEIVDHRYGHFAVGARPVVADNAIHGWWVQGADAPDWRSVDLAAMTVQASCNGEVVTSGVGANALGHPLAVLAWLADELPRHGRRLQAGDLITTGVVTDVFEAAPGDHISATFDGLGTVEVAFTD